MTTTNSSTATPTVPALPASTKADEVIEAMRHIQTEGERWALAEALQRRIPSGSTGFADLIDKAQAEGVAGKLTATTLRLYRDTANRWPKADRVANVSFSAHREAMVLISSTGDTAAAAKMLADLVKNQGVGNVSVASVRRAIAVKQGKALPTKPSASASAGIDVVKDLKKGGASIISSIPATTTPADLEAINAGLLKVIGHVERLRAKAARNAAKAKAAPKVAAPKVAPAPAAGNGATPTPKARPDMRGLARPTK
jgi:hypothetical protein